MSDSTYTPCIAHLPNTGVTVLHEDYLAICEGRFCAAKLLKYFEYLTSVKIEALAESSQEKGIPEIWVYKNDKKLVRRLLRDYSMRSINQELQFLVEKGFLKKRYVFISSKGNKTASNRKKRAQYCLNIDGVQDALNGLDIVAWRTVFFSDFDEIEICYSDRTDRADRADQPDQTYAGADQRGNNTDRLQNCNSSVEPASATGEESIAKLQVGGNKAIAILQSSDEGLEDEIAELQSNDVDLQKRFAKLQTFKEYLKRDHVEQEERTHTDPDPSPQPTPTPTPSTATEPEEEREETVCVSSLSTPGFNSPETQTVELRGRHYNAYCPALPEVTPAQETYRQQLIEHYENSYGFVGDMQAQLQAIDALYVNNVPADKAVQCFNQQLAEKSIWRKGRVSWKSVLTGYSDWELQQRLVASGSAPMEGKRYESSTERNSRNLQEIIQHFFTPGADDCIDITLEDGARTCDTDDGSLGGAT